MATQKRICLKTRNDDLKLMRGLVLVVEVVVVLSDLRVLVRVAKVKTETVAAQE